MLMYAQVNTLKAAACHHDQVHITRLVKELEAAFDKLLESG